MELYLHRFLRELPAGLVETIPIQFFSSDRIILVQAENVFSEQLAFDSYKFLITYHNSHPPIKIGSKRKKLAKRELFSLNPGQAHGFDFNSEVPAYNAIFIDKHHINHTARNVFGSSNVTFENANNTLPLHLFQLCTDFMSECSAKQPGYALALQSLNIQIVLGLLRVLDSNVKHKDPLQKRYHDKRSMRMILDYLYDNFLEDFSLDDLANEVNYSSYHLIRLFKEETGKTPFEYLRDIKVGKAKQLLQDSDKTVTEICYESGFNNRSHFSSVFKKVAGISPSQFRKSL